MPRAEEARAVVWRHGEALLAVPIEAAVEIAAVEIAAAAGDDRALSRHGPLELHTPPGLPPAQDYHRAIIVRTGLGLVALPAEAVEGVLPYSRRDTAATPPWLGRLPTDHVAALIHLDDRRIAALLVVDSLRTRSPMEESDPAESPAEP